MAQVHSVKGFALVDFDGGEFNWVVSLLVPPFVWLSAVLILCSFAGKVLNSSPGNLGPTQPRSHFRTFSLISCFTFYGTRGSVGGGCFERLRTGC